MKNTRQTQLKTCIFCTTDEFSEIFVELFGKYDHDNGNEYDVEFNTCEGIYFCGLSSGEVYEKLSEYFDVTVTSVHMDHCDVPGVWVCYKDEV